MYATQANPNSPESKARFTTSGETFQANKGSDKTYSRPQAVCCLHIKAIDFIYFPSRYDFSDKQSMSDG